MEEISQEVRQGVGLIVYVGHQKGREKVVRRKTVNQVLKLPMDEGMSSRSAREWLQQEKQVV